MRYDKWAKLDMMRYAFDTLSGKNGILHWGDQAKGVPATPIRPIPEKDITIASWLVQEQAFVSTESTYTFEFGSRSPLASPILNNFVLGDNDVVGVYGMILEYGIGPNTNNREYITSGVTPDDNSLYNGQLFLQFENRQTTELVKSRAFRNEESYYDDAGFIFLNPVQIVTGRLGTFEIEIRLPSITGLTITADSFISMQLEVALGRASG